MKSSNILYKKAQLDSVLMRSGGFLYGAGRVAQTIVRHILYNGFAVEGIFVSNIDGNPGDLMEVPVNAVSEYSNVEKKTFLIVCVAEKSHEEVREAVSDFDFTEVFYISDNLFANLAEEQSFYWQDWGEKRIIEENWGIVINRESFGEKFLKLIKGLDEESIETVVRILKRQKQILESNAYILDIFTREEKEKLKDLQENFWPLILELGNHIFSYKQFLLPCNHFEASVFYYKHGIEKCRNLQRIKNKNIIDVGGFIGDSVVVFSELSPKQIISFEAVPEHIKYMEETLKLNHLEHVTLVNCALGKQKGTIRIKLAGSGSTAIDRKGIDFAGEIEVPVISLDEYVEETGLTDVGLIKVDIEGAEPDFLLGAKDTIVKYKPTLLLSIYHNAHDFFELKPLIESWDLGYHFSIHKSVNGNVTNETLLIAEVPN